MQGNVHVASPDRIPAQDDGPTDGVSSTHTDWPVQHEKSLLPVCRPEEKKGLLNVVMRRSF